MYKIKAGNFSCPQKDVRIFNGAINTCRHWPCTRKSLGLQFEPRSITRTPPLTFPPVSMATGQRARALWSQDCVCGVN